MKWKEQWRTPHRLLKKRLLRFPERQDDYHNDYTGDISDCRCEWLVKWCGLDYENSTWELESAAFLKSPQPQSLIRKYENRRQRANRAASFSQLDKVPWRRDMINRNVLSSLSCLNFFIVLFFCIW